MRSARIIPARSSLSSGRGDASPESSRENLPEHRVLRGIQWTRLVRSVHHTAVIPSKTAKRTSCFLNKEFTMIGDQFLIILLQLVGRDNSRSEISAATHA